MKNNLRHERMVKKTVTTLSVDYFALVVLMLMQIRH